MIFVFISIYVLNFKLLSGVMARGDVLENFCLKREMYNETVRNQCSVALESDAVFLWSSCSDQNGQQKWTQNISELSVHIYSDTQRKSLLTMSCLVRFYNELKEIVLFIDEKSYTN